MLAAVSATELDVAATQGGAFATEITVFATVDGQADVDCRMRNTDDGGATIRVMQGEDDAKALENPPTDPEAGPEPWDHPDDALIAWMLSLTPTQRLEALQGWVDSIQALRDGARP